MKRIVATYSTQVYCEGCDSWVPEDTELEGVIHVPADHVWIQNANRALQKLIKKRVAK